ncbi:hypothetical protein [Aminobacter sp. MET-1]|uniref:hypothetical protein n=1 Tax=Aminobacter sp. MET-1 TaxID=2951085 RepID=UPI00226AD804|nr:hypothetical protein [Aminobacter sp. MET-1]MCX8571157.1 hypothetical protein [Aminobacter sp. MET-1]MCX8573345.1 hypothetical protein [Aminobacter sp. MET-1]
MIMAKAPKERVQVGGNLAELAKGFRKAEPVDPSDPALTFIPPLASVDELTSSNVETSNPAIADQPSAEPEAKVDAPAPASSPEPTRPSAPATRAPASERTAPRPQKKVTPEARINRAVSPEYTRVALQLHNDVMSQLFTIALKQNKRYTAVIEDYIMAGLERHKG